MRKLIDEGEIDASPRIVRDQVQPASLDLRLGPKAYRVRASFLPGKNFSVEEKLKDLSVHDFDLNGKGAVLEANGVYLIPLLERLKLRRTVSAAANPKSSIGRLDVFTRLVADNGTSFDEVPEGYEGRLYAEVCPRTFPIKVRCGSRLNQLRFRRRLPARQDRVAGRVSDRELYGMSAELVGDDAGPTIREGLNLRVDLSKRSSSSLIGYKAKRFAGVVDVDAVGVHRISQFWDLIYFDPDGRLILDPTDFYILASKESVSVPPAYVAEMAPFDPLIGEYRVHYAGFFDPGFGYAEGKAPGAKAVLEVRSLDIPFILEDGQIVGRLVYDKLTETPDTLYGGGIGSHYQAQGLKLSKHFKQD
ncbi:MAG: 2'-deoxycytidine 5'-triphosphate deaminase [Methyloceanibacter sp.]|nr:2'-deoxycytidine 5'-triphosphate deaminase [Methyloceanibacter sp.]